MKLAKIECSQCGKEIDNSCVDFTCPHCGCKYIWDEFGITLTIQPNE